MQSYVLRVLVLIGQARSVERNVVSAEGRAI